VLAAGVAHFGLLVLASLLLARPVAQARPVTIGVYQELPFGVARSHPSVTEGVRNTRDGRSTARVPVRPPSVTQRVEIGARHVSAPILLSNPSVLAVSADRVSYVSAVGERVGEGTPLRGAGGVSLAPSGYVVAETDGLAFLSAALEVVARVPIAGLADAAPLVLADGSAVVSAGAQLLRVDARGTQRFSVSVASRTHSPVARTPGGHLVAATTTELLIVDQDGRVMRREALGDQPVAGPAVALDGSIWMLTRRGLSVFDADGAPRAQVPSPTGGPLTHGSLAIATDGSLRAAIMGFGLLALNSAGVRLWAVEAPQVRFAVVDAVGATLALTHDGSLLAVDAAGQERWRAGLDGQPHAAPVLGSDGSVYVGLRGGVLVVLR
jgi:hypothetical protein